jgi:glutamate racemase
MVSSLRTAGSRSSSAPVRNASASAIGVFDSGVGGLSVLRHIRAQLPSVPLLYVADSGHVPYGDKTQDYIRERSLALTEFLVGQGAAAVVIACNTATAAAAAMLRERFTIPIVAMEPAVKPAVSATRSGVVGVLATVGTLESARFAALLEQYAGDVEIVTQACPGLVEQVEAGELASAATRALVERYARALVERGADTIVLGCTHYPFLRSLISEIIGPGVQLIDTGEAVARQVVRRLPEAVIGRIDAKPTERFWTTGDARSAARIMGQLWGRGVAVEAL